MSTIGYLVSPNIWGSVPYPVKHLVENVSQVMYNIS